MASGLVQRRAVELWQYRLRQMLRDRLLERVPLNELDEAAAGVAARRVDPYSVIERCMHELMKVEDKS